MSSLGNLYKWLWSHTTGRPYTYLIRDFYHENPILWIFLEAWVIWGINHFFDIEWYVWVFITLGVVLGHLFWGKAWVPDEGEKQYK